MKVRTSIAALALALGATTLMAVPSNAADSKTPVVVNDPTFVFHATAPVLKAGKTCATTAEDIVLPTATEGPLTYIVRHADAGPFVVVASIPEPEQMYYDVNTPGDDVRKTQKFVTFTIPACAPKPVTPPVVKPEPVTPPAPVVTPKPEPKPVTPPAPVTTPKPEPVTPKPSTPPAPVVTAPPVVQTPTVVTAPVVTAPQVAAVPVAAPVTKAVAPAATPVVPASVPVASTTPAQLASTGFDGGSLALAILATGLGVALIVFSRRLAKR